MLGIHTVFKINRFGQSNIHVGRREPFTIKELEDSVFCVALDSRGREIFKRDLGYPLAKAAFDFYSKGKGDLYRMIQNLLQKDEYIKLDLLDFVKEKNGTFSHINHVEQEQIH